MAAPKKIFEFAEKAKEQITGDENLYIPIPGTNYRVKLSTLLAWLQEQGMDGLWQVTGTGENTVLEAVPVAPVKITAPEATNKQLAGLAIDAEGKVQKISALEFITLTDAAEVDWDMNDGPFAQVTLGGNRELVITNPKPGAVVFVVNQDVTGGRQLTFPAGSKYIMGFSINPQAESQTVVTGFYNGAGWLWTSGDYTNTIQPSGVVDVVSNQTVNGIKTFGSIPVLPASNPTTDNQSVRKKYADDTFVDKSTTQTVNGIKTFGSIPVLPASNPTTDNQTTRKRYVDDLVAANKTTPIITVSASRNLANSDFGAMLVCTNSSPITLTIPASLMSNFKCGVTMDGTGTVTVSPASGVTLNSDTNKRLISTRYIPAAVLWISSDNYRLYGRLSA